VARRARKFRQAAASTTEIAALFPFGTLPAISLAWAQSRARTPKKEVSNVHFDPPDRQCFRGRHHHLAGVRQLRDQRAPDCLTYLSKDEFQMNQRFLLNREQGKVMGVAAGLADWTGIDSLVIRLALVVATLITGPVMILLYILTGWLASDR
jgi:phage shock protein C